jgi:arsenate reductase
MMDTKVYNVLFLCTGNSARSIMAECSLRRWGRDRFRAFSAGSHPIGRIHPLTLELLHRLKHSTQGLRSKSWDEFATSDSPPLDFVFTVCEKAAGEACPACAGQTLTAHRGVEDPAAFQGPPEQQLKMFERAYFELDNRIKIFTSLRLDDLNALTLQRRLDEIGGTRREIASTS